MSTLFWTFLTYSFLGFVLEVVFARATRCPKRDRKCFLLLPLCPVYGLGALGILALPDWVAARWPLLVLLGALTATAAEYVMALFYEKTLGVKFWDYSDFRWNLRGRVCLSFSGAWGLLAAAARYWLHPILAPWLAAVPAGWTGPMVALLTLDSFATLALLTRTGSVESLRWYDRLRPGRAR